MKYKKNGIVPYAKLYGVRNYAAYDPEIAGMFSIYTAIIFNQLYRMLEFAVKKTNGLDALDKEANWNIEFYMALSTMARQTRIPQSTISDCITRLEKEGFVHVRRLPKCNVYKIQWDAVHNALKHRNMSSRLVYKEEENGSV
jgi:hypothetical protein